MGIDDEDFYKARKVNSDSQLYKQAGNAIVVDVLAAIFMQLFKANKKKWLVNDYILKLEVKVIIVYNPSKRSHLLIIKKSHKAFKLCDMSE